jgi:hypothetical protein
VEDAATAMLAALSREAAGVLNIVDDAPRQSVIGCQLSRRWSAHPRRDACHRQSFDSPLANGAWHF